MKRCMVVHSNNYPVALKQLPRDIWHVISFGQATSGRRFDIVVCEQPIGVDENKWVDKCVKTKLPPKKKVKFIEDFKDWLLFDGAET